VGLLVSNAISQQELEDLRVPGHSPSLKLIRAGWIQPSPSGGSCQAKNMDDVWGCVLYAHIVDWKVMKFGTTSSFKERMEDNADTINDILRFQDDRNPNPAPWLKNLALGKGDQFKKQAPELIRAGRRIEAWATTLFTPKACQNSTGRKNSRCAACKHVEKELNGRYQTIQYGWALKLS